MFLIFVFIIFRLIIAHLKELIVYLLIISNAIATYLFVAMF